MRRCYNKPLQREMARRLRDYNGCGEVPGKIQFDDDGRNTLHIFQYMLPTGTVPAISGVSRWLNSFLNSAKTAAAASVEAPTAPLWASWASAELCIPLDAAIFLPISLGKLQMTLDT